MSERTRDDTPTKGASALKWKRYLHLAIPFVTALAVLLLASTRRETRVEVALTSIAMLFTSAGTVQLGVHLLVENRSKLLGSLQVLVGIGLMVVALKVLLGGIECT